MNTIHIKWVGKPILPASAFNRYYRYVAIANGSSQPVENVGFTSLMQPIVQVCYPLTPGLNRLSLMVNSSTEVAPAGPYVELHPWQEQTVFYFPGAQDSDADGLQDALETSLGTDPNKADSDGDGLTDGEEVNTYSTDPLEADTDGDLWSDLEEILYGADPLEDYPTPAFTCMRQPAGLINWWPGEDWGTDLIGGKEATLVNGTLYGMGKVQRAFHFDGVNDYAWAGPIPALDPLKQMTIETWVQVGAHFLPEGVVNRFVTIGQDKIGLRYDGESGPGQLHFYMNINGQLVHVRANNVLQGGTWHHVAGSYDGSRLRMYLDGQEVGSQPGWGALGIGNYVAFSLESEPLEGFLDEISFYNRALSATEIRLLYMADARGKCSIGPP